MPVPRAAIRKAGIHKPASCHTLRLRTGVPLSILFWILSVTYIPRFWSF